MKKPFSKPVVFAVAVFLWTVAFFFLSLHVVTANPRQEDSFFVQLERNMTQSHVLQPIGSLRLDDEDRQKIESRIGSNGIAISKHSLSFQPFFRNEQVSEIIPPFHFAEFDNAILSSYPLLVGKVPLAEQDILLTSLHLYLWNRLGYRNPYDATDFIQPGKVTPEKLIGKRSFVLARTFPITSADS